MFAYVTVSDSLSPPVPVTVAVQGVNAAPLNGTLAGQLTVTVDVAFVMLHAPFTKVIAKLAEPPVTVGVTVPDPAAGPTEAGLFVQPSPVVNAPVIAQATGACADPSKRPLKLPAVAVTDTGPIVKVAELFAAA